MKKILKFLKPFGFPLQTIKEERWSFVTWVVALIAFGLTGFWLPLLDKYFKGGQASDINNIIINGSLSTFSLVILVEGFLNFFNIQALGGTKLTNGVKSIVFIFTIIVFTMNIYLYGKTVDPTAIQRVADWIVVFTIMSILLAGYLFCFKRTNWEITANAYVEAQDQAVAEAAAQVDNPNPIP